MIYFDNAATTYPKPPAIQEAVARAMRDAGGNPGRSSHALSLAAAEMVEGVREALGELLEAPDPGHIVFTMNATHALNLAIYTRVRRGSHILLSDREHNAVYRPVCRLAREGIADFDIFSTKGDVCQNILALLRPETDMLICTHISNVDGAEAPIAQIGELCRARGIYFIVDASQSVGHRPFSVKRCQADAVCAPAHKGLFGLPGLGFAWLREEGGLRTFIEGGSGSHSRSPQMPPFLPERLEAGTLPTPAIAALGAGIAFIRRKGPRAICEAETRLLHRMVGHLQRIPAVQVFAPPQGGVLSFSCHAPLPDVVARQLDAHHICVRHGLHCAPLAHMALGTEEHGTVRLSFSCLNTVQEVDQAARVLRHCFSAPH